MGDMDLSQLVEVARKRIANKTELWATKKVPAQEEPQNSLELALKEAKEEWDNAKAFFNEVIEGDLVDCAIYQIEAAERRYMHLLKLIKSESENLGKVE